MFTKKFWTDAFERMVKTVAQSVLAYVIAAKAIGLFELDFMLIVSVSLLAGLVSLLTSIVSSQVGNKDNASLVK